MDTWKKYVLWFAQEHVDFRLPVSFSVSINEMQINLDQINSGTPIAAPTLEYSTQTSAEN